MFHRIKLNNNENRTLKLMKKLLLPLLFYENIFCNSFQCTYSHSIEHYAIMRKEIKSNITAKHQGHLLKHVWFKSTTYSEGNHPPTDVPLTRSTHQSS